MRLLRATAIAVGTVALLAAAPVARALAVGASISGVGGGVSVGGGSGVGVEVDIGDDGIELDLGPGGGAGVPGTAVVRPLGQEGALEAVKANRALPLEDILIRARLVAEGEIIDAQLIQVRSILVYEIKVLGRTGEVSMLYFYARSGALVAPR